MGCRIDTWTWSEVRTTTHGQRQASTGVATFRQTILALQQWFEQRPKPKVDTDTNLVFLTIFGAPWNREPTIDGDPKAEQVVKNAHDSPVAKTMAKLLPQGQAPAGLGFYALRRTFETVAGESRDQVAVNAVMGHAPASNDMASVYRERISDERLKAVAEHVRKWLWPKRQAKIGKSKPRRTPRKPK